MGAHQAHLEEEVELLVSERLHREATHDRGRGVEARPARSLVVCAAAVWQAFEHNGLIVGGTVSGSVGGPMWPQAMVRHAHDVESMPGLQRGQDDLLKAASSVLLAGVNKGESGNHLTTSCLPRCF